VLPLSIENQCVGYIAFARTDAALSREQELFTHQLRDLVSVALASARLVVAMDALSRGALRALARAIDAKSSWTAGHSERVTAVALAIGRRLGLDEADMERLERGGLLHDVGKIGVAASVLDKPDKLDAEEWAQMKAHTTLGARILEPISRYADVLPIVLYHHERLDGTGYPEGLAGENIPLLARVLAVADVYDALVSDRPYRAGMEDSVALSIIERGIGTHFDPRPARAFLDLMREQNGAEREALASLRDRSAVAAVA
jgi:putative nucleotidyltransferase with HDIG domain